MIYQHKFSAEFDESQFCKLHGTKLTLPTLHCDVPPERAGIGSKSDWCRCNQIVITSSQTDSDTINIPSMSKLAGNRIDVVLLSHSALKRKCHWLHRKLWNNANFRCNHVTNLTSRWRHFQISSFQFQCACGHLLEGSDPVLKQYITCSHQIQIQIQKPLLPLIHTMHIES